MGMEGMPERGADVALMAGEGCGKFGLDGPNNQRSGGHDGILA